MAPSLLKHYVVPIVSIVGGPLLSQYLANYSSVDGLDGFRWQMFFGNIYSWIIVGSWVVWCSGFLMIPFDRYKGLTNMFGYSPIYTDNCTPLLFCTIICYMTFHTMWPNISIDIHRNFPYIVGSLNIVGMLLCLFLWYDARERPAVGLQRSPAPGTQAPPPSAPLSEKAKRAAAVEASLPAVYRFYRGTEIHPTVLGFDVKQWATMRMGMLAWTILVHVFVIAAYHIEGFSIPLLANVILQVVYLIKFSEWETSYLTTMDITSGRAGFYLCWGSVVLLPTLGTYSTYYMVTHPPNITFIRSLLTLAVGLAVIRIRYQIESQRDLFKETNGECKIWGRKVTYVEAEYQSANGPKKYRLLTSGFWGMSRHLNYLFDLLSAIIWCSLNFGTDSLHPYLYPLILTVIYVMRAYENDKRCLKKYGKDWIRYCEVNKYKIIPYIF